MHILIVRFPVCLERKKKQKPNSKRQSLDLEEIEVLNCMHVINIIVAGPG